MAAGIFDITEYGGVAGTNCDTAVEAAYQAAKAYNKPSTIHFGAGEWKFTRPLVAGLSDLTIRGEGTGTTRLTVTNASFSPIFLGVNRTSGGKTLGAVHRPDAFGKLDTHAAPTTGVRYGYRTQEAHLGFWASPFDRGASDGWKSVTKLTVAWCQEGGRLRFGMLASGDRPDPWYVEDQGGQYYFKFYTTAGVWRTIGLAIPGDHAALHRFAVQLDLDAGTWQFYADAFQRGAGTMPPGEKFVQLSQSTFGIGHMGTDLALTPSVADRTLYAMRITAGPVYYANGVDTPQLRLDGTWGAGIDTHYTYLSDDLIACLDTSKPAEWPAGPAPPAEPSRAIRYTAGLASGAQTTGYGLFLHSGYHGGGTYNPLRQSIHDLTIDLNWARWGNALTIGGVLNLNAYQLELMAGWHVLGSAPMGACWPTRIVDVFATYGYDASVSLYGHSLFMQRLDCGWCGTTAIRLKGCAGSVRDVWINGQVESRSESTIEVTGLDDATTLSFDHIKCNQEGYPYPTIAGFHIIPGKDTKPIPMRVRLDEIHWGNVGPGASLVRLEEGPATSRTNKCHFTLDGATMESSDVGVVTTGPRWIGTVDPGPSLPEKQWLVHDGPGESGLELIGPVTGEGGGTQMASLMYNSAIVKLQDGTIDLNTDTINAMLVTSAYVVDKDAHATRADVTGEVVGTGYTAGGKPLANKGVTQDNANDRGKFDADDVTWTAATLTARGAVLYKSRGGAASADELIDYLDFGADISSTNGPFTLEFPADGIHYIG